MINKLVHFINFLKVECQFFYIYINHLGSRTCILLYNGGFQYLYITI